jgi:hypothetical protein
MTSIDSAVPSPERLDHVVTMLSNTLTLRKDLILHAARDRVGFYKDLCPHEDQGINLYLPFTLLFSICPYLYVDQTRCHVSMGIDIASWPSRLGGIITSATSSPA